MNYNILSYTIYLPITFYITFIVGKICYKNGEIYLLRLMNEHQDTVKAMNRLLLIGYYLLNLGYAALMLSDWPLVANLSETILISFTRVGIILFLLGIMHYFNMLMTYYISKRINKISNIKSLTL